jgi:hypothetical protein
VFGDFYGDRLDSTPFVFPVNITNATNMFIAGTCPLASADDLPEPVNACSTTQDSQLICCDNGGTAICPPTIVAP